jgi:type I restriction enzyme S subunit
MNFERLGNIITIHKGRKNEITENPSVNSVRVLQIDDLRNDSLIKYTDEKVGVLVNEEDLMIAWDGANAGTVGYGKSGYIGSTIAALRKIEPQKYSTVFLGYFLKSQFSFFQKNTTGATIPHIDRKSLENLPIPVLSIEDQVRVGSILSKSEILIAQRKESISLLDDFLKSTYFKMFIADQSKKWETVTIASLAKNEKGSMRTGPFGSDLLHSEFTVTGYAKVLGIDNVVNNIFEFGEPRFITAEKFEKLKRYTVHPNDILISIMGTTGRTAVVPEYIPLSINTKHLAAITLDLEKANPHFISYSLRINPLIIKQIKDRTRGAIMDGLNLGIIKALVIAIPPIEHQTQFADIERKIDFLKSQCDSNLRELENLYGSLIQRAFTGELDLSNIQVDVSEYHTITQNNEISTNSFKRPTKNINDLREVVKVVAMQSVANKMIEYYKGFHFSFEMLRSFMEREEINYDEYFSSEEMKKNPKLNVNPDNVEDLKNFVSSAIVNHVSDLQLPKNPWIKLNQLFYDASKTDLQLNLRLEDIEKTKTRSIEEQSGIYFEIIS